MKPGRTGKLILGGLTTALVVGPFLLIGVIMLMMFVFFIAIAGADPNSGPPPLFFLPFGMMFLMMPLQFVFVFLVLALQVYYFIHLIQNSGAPAAARILLGLGFFYVPYLAFPIYFLMYVWPSPPVAPAPPAPRLAPARVPL